MNGSRNTSYFMKNYFLQKDGVFCEWSVLNRFILVLCKQKFIFIHYLSYEIWLFFHVTISISAPFLSQSNWPPFPMPTNPRWWDHRESTTLFMFVTFFFAWIDILHCSIIWIWAVIPGSNDSSIARVLTSQIIPLWNKNLY